MTRRKDGKLQWGRDLSAAETRSRESWDGDRRLLQWGRDLSAAETTRPYVIRLK